MGQGTTVPRCSKCGRVLKSPESIARGIGPECAGLRGYARAPKKPGIRRGRRGTYAAGDSSSGSGEPAVPVVHDDLHEESVADGVADGEK